MIKINKRKCREYANPDRKMRPDNGILHAKAIDYIITTDIKIIARHRTLILYICPREEACRGDCSPLWTIFHTKDDFKTLARKDDGSTIWRTASFDRLDGCYYRKQYAFYSAQDEKRIQRYFKTDADGLQAVSDVQYGILGRRRHERQTAREKAIVNCMAGIPSLPRGLKSWVKSIMPAYFFYDYKRRSKNVSGVCSACGHEATLPSIRMGSKAVCPHCKHELTAKPRSRRGSNMYDRETFEVIQNMGDGRLVIRIIKAYFSYTADTPDVDIYENTRQFVWQDADGKFCTEHYYYYSSSGILTSWKKGALPISRMYQYCFDGDTCGHLYTKNLPEALSGTPWQYCTIADFYNYFHENMQALPFLRGHLEYPKLEHLCKVGFYSIASDLVYANTEICLDETQNRTHKLLGVAAEDVHFLRDMDIGLSALAVFQTYSGLRDRQRLFAWQLKHDADRDIMDVLRHMTVHKFITYMDKQYSFLQFRKTPHNTQRYGSMQDLVSEYRDYIEICSKLNCNLKNNFVLFPKDIQKEHDKAAHRINRKADAEAKRKFTAVYKSISEQMSFEKGGFQIICPSAPDDVIFEGQALHHCVGNYVDRILRNECLILFLRKCCEKQKPYYTIEIRSRRIVQVRGMKNCPPTDEINKFLDEFKRKVLQASAGKAA